MCDVRGEVVIIDVVVVVVELVFVIDVRHVLCALLMQALLLFVLLFLLFGNLCFWYGCS